MKRGYRFIKILLFLTCVSSSQTFQIFYYTGATQNFTVPYCTGDLSITARGAQGGSAAWSGGDGALVRVTITPTPGAVLYLNVGGQPTGTVGGWNGGGEGGMGSTSAGAGGGGATDVRLNGNSLSDRILVAGGGGGGTGNQYLTGYGGNAGYLINCN